MPLKKIKMAAFGGLCLECYDLLLSTMNSVCRSRKCSEERFQGLKQEKWAVKDVVKVEF